MDCVRSLLHTAKLEKKFWAEALATAVYIRNRVFSQSLPKDVTPHHRWMKKSPDLSYFRIFGSKCWYVIPKHQVQKLDARSKAGIMMGYSSMSKGYKIWDIESSKLVISRDVTFDEVSTTSWTTEMNIDNPQSINVAGPGGDMKDEVDDNSDLTPDNPEQTEATEAPNSDNEFEDAQDNVVPPLRRSDRIRKQAGEWWVTKPSLLSQGILVHETPTSYKVATSPENINFWQPGIEREHDCLIRNHTWDYVGYMSGMKVLPCK